MDAESRKRKMENDEDEDEDDEEKMQKFFALIRSTREAHKQIMSGTDKLQEEEKKIGEEGKPAETWNPSFELEDFIEGSADQFKGPPPQASLALAPALAPAGPPKTEEETKEEEEDHKGSGNDDLDLKLSL